MLITLKNNKQITILTIILVGLMIPNVIVYLEHSLLELDESKESVEKGSINQSTICRRYLFCIGSNWLYYYHYFDIC
jgi:hypothetical protein